VEVERVQLGREKPAGLHGHSVSRDADVVPCGGFDVGAELVAA
jgi:hypothetical protein